MQSSFLTTQQTQSQQHQRHTSSSHTQHRSSSHHRHSIIPLDTCAQRTRDLRTNSIPRSTWVTAHHSLCLHTQSTRLARQLALGLSRGGSCYTGDAGYLAGVLHRRTRHGTVDCCLCIAESAADFRIYLWRSCVEDTAECWCCDAADLWLELGADGVELCIWSRGDG